MIFTNSLQNLPANGSNLTGRLRLLLHTLLAKQHLSAEQSQQMLAAMISGELPPEWLAALLIALEAKGITEQELLGAAQAMRAAMVPVSLADKTYLVDTCGTGGDGAGIFNISTASAFVAAAAGASVAKHGNRSVSSASGSADLLTQAGAKIALNAVQVKKSIEQTGLGFMFAPMFHPAMKHVAAVRHSLGVKTLFNLLGPLVNPAGVMNQVVGVYQADLMPLVIKVLAELGSKHVLVVHAEDGLDEISIAAPTRVIELKQGNIQSYQLKPEDFGLSAFPLESIRVADAEQSLKLMKAAFGEAKAKSSLEQSQIKAAEIAIVLNAGTALYAANQALSLADGIALAQATLSEGKALNKLREFVQFTQSFVK